MTVAKSLGFTESQIGGFSRRGSKMTKSTYAISPLQELANKVQRLNAQYHLMADRAEEAKIAQNTAYRAYVEAKKILDDAIRSAGRSEQAPPQSERHSRGLSRNGAKAINGVDSDSGDFFLDPKHFFRLFREEYLDAINGLLDVLGQPKMFLSDSTGLSKIRDVLDDLQDSADDAGISLPSKVQEACHTAKRGRFSRTGGKANFVEGLPQWESYFNQDALVTLANANQLLQKIKDKKGDLIQTESNIAEGIALLKKSLTTQNTAQYYRANKILGNADRVRSSFSRTGAKARFAVRRPSLTLDQVNEINQILNWYQSLKKMEKSDLYTLYVQKMKRGNVQFKPDIREMRKDWMAVDIIRTQFREDKVQAAFDASPSGKPLPLPITHARNGAKAAFGSGDSCMVEGYVGNAITGGRSAGSFDGPRNQSAQLLLRALKIAGQGHEVSSGVYDMTYITLNDAAKRAMPRSAMMSRVGSKAKFGKTLEQHIAVEHDAKRQVAK